MADFVTTYVIPGAWMLGHIALIVGVILLAVAYLTYAERKVLGAAQLRQGPNMVGPFGLLQPIADGVKLLSKEIIIPSGANRLIFVLAPMLTFFLALVAWAVIPVDENWVLANINVVFCISSPSHPSVFMA